MAAFQKSIKIVLLLMLAVFILPAAGFAVTSPVVQVLGSVRTGVITPVRMAEDSAGNFYLTDPKAGGVLKFDRTGLLKTTFTFKKPQGIAVTGAGDLIVGQGDSVSVVDSLGNLKFRLGKGAGTGEEAPSVHHRGVKALATATHVDASPDRGHDRRHYVRSLGTVTTRRRH